MKVSDATILMLRGETRPGAGLWIDRWTDRLSTALAVPPPEGGDDCLPELIGEAPGPVVAIAYREGVERLLSVADEAPVCGAFLVAPPGGDALAALEQRDDPLPFPSILVASRDDPECAFERADAMGARWGSMVIDAGEAGRIDAASGRGPWPEGLMTFARFMSRLDTR